MVGPTLEHCLTEMKPEGSLSSAEPSMKKTIYDLAEIAGVSIATISRATNLSTRSKIAPETLEKIDRTIEKYGYSPTLTASRLAGKAFKTVGFLMPHFEGIFFSDYYASVLSGVSDAVLSSEYHFKMVLMKPSYKSTWDRHDFRAAEDVDALLVTHWPNFFSQKKALKRIGVPCVVINDPEEDLGVNFVAGDSFSGGEQVARYLLSKGCKKFLMVEGEHWSGDSQGRRKGFESVCRSSQIKIDYLQGDYQEEKAERLVEEYFQSKKSCDAIFCLNDHMAIGALRAFKRVGLRCPKDVLVVGYDNDRVASVAPVPLTTVRVPVYQMAKDAAERLVRYLDGDKKALDRKVTYYPVELILRKSA